MADKDGGPERPKIHVDDDWKREAQAEKERLDREAQAAAGPQGPRPADAPPTGRAAAHGERMRLPPASFSALVQTLATQAMIFMSDEHDPQTGESLRRLDMAKHQIDILGMLEEKTKGNLTEDEKRLLDAILYELRMAYVNEASA